MPSSAIEAHREWLLEGPRDIELQDIVDPQMLDGDWRALLTTIRAALRGWSGRLGIHGPYDGLSLLTRDPQARDFSRARLLRALEFAAMIGEVQPVSHMVIHSPFLFQGHPQVVHTSSRGLSEEIARVQLLLEPVIAQAERQGCTLMIENIHDANPAALVALVASFDTPFVRVSVDVGHATITQVQRGGPSADVWIAAAGELLGHVHLHDNDGQYDAHWAAGRGLVNWWAVFAALAEHRAANPVRLMLESRVPHLMSAAVFLSGLGLSK